MAWLRRQPEYSPGRLLLRLGVYLDMLRLLVAAVPVDEAWYLAQSPGLAAVIQPGRFESASHHFLMHGYFEDRSPGPPQGPSASMPRYRDIRRMLAVTPMRGRLHVEVDEAVLHDIIAQFLTAIPVDETWYLKTNPTVAADVRDGRFESGAAHFRQHGYYEGRSPFPTHVDEAWYCATFADVKAAVASGEVVSATQHYEDYGYREGRLPAARWIR
jgi:hypothetical protein